MALIGIHLYFLTDTALAPVRQVIALSQLKTAFRANLGRPGAESHDIPHWPVQDVLHQDVLYQPRSRGEVALWCSSKTPHKESGRLEQERNGGEGDADPIGMKSSAIRVRRVRRSERGNAPENGSESGSP